MRGLLWSYARKCLGRFNPKHVPSSVPIESVCQKCTISVLPFCQHNLLFNETSETIQSVTDREDVYSQIIYEHEIALQDKSNQLKLVHINTQSMVSTFDELVLTMKGNPYLLQHVNIPGYSNVFRNRDRIRGGSVGAYLRDGIDVKWHWRNDIENIEPELENLWLEIKGRNRHSKMLLGVVYRSERIQDFNTWLDKMENLLSQLNVLWNGIFMITGYMNDDHWSGN